MSVEWSKHEVDLIVADYFDMLRAELSGRPFSKTEHRKTISSSLPARSKGSIEFKHQNISAVLINRGLPYVDGYKPRGNYQRLLAESVDEFLVSQPELVVEFAASPRLNPSAFAIIGTGPTSQLFESPPDRIVIPQEQSEPWLSRRVRIQDFARLDAENKRLGDLGEKFAVDLEQRRLKEAGRDDLAEKVDWVAKTCGDGLGFDVLSFDEHDDRERFIEVKTTTLGKYFPFYVTRNEVRCSAAMPEKYNLYRVFDFTKSPRLYRLQGTLDSVCDLQPVLFRAAIAS